MIEEMKNEFKKQMKQNNDEWNKRLEAQRRGDNEWDRRIKYLNDYTKEAIGIMMITIKEILLDTKETKNIRTPTSAEKIKVDTRREEEYEEYDDEGNQNTIDSNLVNTRLRIKVSMYETVIRALEQKLMDQDRDLPAKSNIEKKTATKKNDKNEQIQLPENQNAEQKYIVWKCMSWDIRGWRGKKDKTKKKIRKIKSKIEGYDVIILTETHLSKE